MTQTVAATAQLGPDKTGLAIGLRVLNMDGTVYSAFSTTGVAETSVLGTYRKANGVVVPDAGGTIVWGVSGTDYVESPVDPASPTAAAVGSEVWTGAYTRQINSVTGSVGSVANAETIADEVLKRDWTAVTGEASRSLLNALRFLRNKWSISGTTLTVTEEDDSTPAWTATLTSDAAADPVTGSDPI